MKSQYKSLIGFILLAFGILSLVLSLVGLRLDILSFLYKVGPGFAFLIHLFLVFGGAIILYMSKVKEDQ